MSDYTYGVRVKDKGQDDFVLIPCNKEDAWNLACELANREARHEAMMDYGDKVSVDYLYEDGKAVVNYGDGMKRFYTVVNYMENSYEEYMELIETGEDMDCKALQHRASEEQND